MSFFLKPMYFWILHISFNWLIAFLQRVEICLLKDSVLPILIPSSFMQFSELIVWLLIFRAYESFILQFFLTTMAWNLSGFTIISFILNQSTAAWLSYSNVEICFSIVFSAVLIMLSSAKFSKSVCDTQRYKSLINMLNKSSPSIELSGTSDNRIWKTLNVLFILTFCLHLFKYK